MRLLAAVLFAFSFISISSSEAKAQSLNWYLENYVDGQVELEQQMNKHGPEANKAMWKLYVTNMNSFALGVIETVGKVTNKDLLVTTFKELSLAEGTLELILKTAQSEAPPDREFIAEIVVALVNVRNAKAAVVQQYVALGGDKSDLEKLKIEPSPIIERLEKDLLDRQ